ncbi:predicted protein [Naegleria gruberi]|uniref:Predicted protein n=1 Tax=Naegleria gruberi TaxID=5762 RepID=D2V035_NAEGR|nr:uncharacterized protein NAEGRDRAFT_45611 [Naegleria gruberi]EFC49460.1 predicted protein [Naegleria gruberi]|eukprot:XP_002682204.1 predicted protein [Naegleria gruberi strain NEG-M]
MKERTSHQENKRKRTNPEDDHQYESWLNGNFDHSIRSEIIETYELDENTLVINHFGISREEIMKRLLHQQVVKPLKVRKIHSSELSSEKQEEKTQVEEILTKLTDLNSDIWLEIYAFIGVENVLVNEIFLLNKEMMSNLYWNPSFWYSIVGRMWNGNLNQLPILYDYEFVRKYCIFKSKRFLEQLQKQTYYTKGQVFHSVISDLQSIPIFSSDMKDVCFVQKVLNGNLNYFHVRTVRADFVASINVIFDIFLKEKLSHLSLHVILNGSCHVESTLVAIYNGEQIPIIKKAKCVKKGIKELVRVLGIDESEIFSHLGFESHRFERLKFGALMQDEYFLWFCNSILEYVPIPIEHAYGLVDYSNDPNYGVDDERNEKIEEYYQLKNFLCIQ